MSDRSPTVLRRIGSIFIAIRFSSVSHGRCGWLILRSSVSLECLPRTAYLDQYGDAFPDFLRHFPPAASLPYIADVAALEWAANRALHAADDAPLELSRLTELTSEEQRRVSFRPHSSIGLLRSDFPVDEIWRAVLDSDDQAFAALDLAAGPVFLLVERSETGIEVTRTQRPAWNFLAALCRGHLPPG